MNLSSSPEYREIFAEPYLAEEYREASICILWNAEKIREFLN